MKKMLMSALAVLSIYAASAQLSAGVYGNYTMYKQDFKKNTPGAGVRVYYNAAEKYAISLGFTYGAPIKTESAVTIQNNQDANDMQTVASEIAFKFKTINLMAHYNFIGDAESMGKLYGSFGAGLVLVSWDEKIKGNYDKANFTAMDQVKGKENGFTINLGIGGEYKIGRPGIFAEAGIALPANKVGDSYVENVIPTHFMLNAGIRLPLGSN